MKEVVPLLLAAALACSCKSKPAPAAGSGSASSGSSAAGSASMSGGGSGSAARPPAPRAHDKITRADFNRWAVRLNQPVYWIVDNTNPGTLDPDEVAALLFYPAEPRYVEAGAFTADLEAVYDQIVAAAAAAVPVVKTDEQRRQQLVAQDLDQGRPTLVRTDFTALSDADKAFVRHMLAIGALIDDIYAIQTGAAPLAEHVPADPASQSLFRRNRGPKCVAPATEKEPLCSAIPESPKPIVGVYPPAVAGIAQTDPKFCATLEAQKDATKLLEPFTVVRDQDRTLVAVPYTEAFATQMAAIAKELTAAADAVTDPKEQPLVAYLRAAAASFGTNDWLPADEAWAKMSVDNSAWYVRVGPDEDYWEPCSHKAGFHLTFARINQGSVEWQKKLVPVQQDMEAAVAAKAGAPYKARPVTFHLPDFIDIVVNAGDDRSPTGATIGQSLPNWGPVANEGRGRTVAMSNLYTDPDSMERTRALAESVFDSASMAGFSDSAEPGLVTTILHEATHNLGPAHEYAVKGKPDSVMFGGPIASMMEELKAQTGALFLVQFLLGKKLIAPEFAAQLYTEDIDWALGQISQGMYDAAGKAKPYPNLAAIQIGFLLEHGALSWNAKATAANGKDTGAFTIHPDKLAAASDQLMALVAGIKARGDRKAAEALIKRYVAGKVVPHAVIAERFNRFPKASFVYSVAM